MSYEQQVLQRSPGFGAGGHLGMYFGAAAFHSWAAGSIRIGTVLVIAGVRQDILWFSYTHFRWPHFVPPPRALILLVFDDNNFLVRRLIAAFPPGVT
jgi:hypothetical protein